MQIAVFGAGGVGGYFGGRLAQAGHAVTFIARGEHLEAIRENGLRVESVHGDFVIRPATATDDSAAVGPMEYVLLAVKNYHLRVALPAIAPLVGAETTVVPLLNGVQAPEILGERFERSRITGGLCSVFSEIAKPGLIRQVSQVQEVVVGEMDGRRSRRLTRLVEALAESGVDAVLSEDIRAAMWEKFMFIASLAGVGSLARATVGEILGLPRTRSFYIQALQEAEAVARARQVHLPESIVAERLYFTELLEPEATTSMHRDVIAGKPFELEAFSGAIVRMADDLGLATPAHQAMYSLLLPALKRAMPHG
jgi:2-dehydropantoate 2-reductase